MLASAIENSRLMVCIWLERGFWRESGTVTMRFGNRKSEGLMWLRLWPWI